MNVTKKNGIVVLYDTEKIISSILKAGTGAPEEAVTRQTASFIADETIARLTREYSIITTQDIRDTVYKLLNEMNLPHTAQCYINYKKHS